MGGKCNRMQTIEQMYQMHGGYWRYPDLLDFYYLVNPYFPPNELICELKNKFEILLESYPSGMRINAMLAAKYFEINEENIIIGNGSAELIKCLMEHIRGKVGVIKPTFDEYPNRYNRQDIVEFWPDNPNYSYTILDLMLFCEKNSISNLILINPDNPSGNYIPKEDLKTMIEWTVAKNIILIIDESFADFSDEENATLVQQETLDFYPNLIVIKSISKAYGIPGIRLGIMASGNTEMIKYFKRNIPIWNINSFAEYYMQISKKYQNQYQNGMLKFRNERKRYLKELSKLKDLRIIPSQANYVMVEVLNGMSSGSLTNRLLQDYHILIRDLQTKLQKTDKHYVRLAIRDTTDNDKLIQALNEIFS